MSKEIELFFVGSIITGIMEVWIILLAAIMLYYFIKGVINSANNCAYALKCSMYRMYNFIDYDSALKEEYKYSYNYMCDK